MTTTIADLPTWTGPAWATEHVETNGGNRWTRRPTTVVTDCPQPTRSILCSRWLVETRRTERE